eukprot:4456626-Pleurochrysis_carterae.AAC.2
MGAYTCARCVHVLVLGSIRGELGAGMQKDGHLHIEAEATRPVPLEHSMRRRSQDDSQMVQDFYAKHPRFTKRSL